MIRSDNPNKKPSLPLGSYLSEVQAMAPIGSLWLHNRRGTTYHVVGYCRIEKTGLLAILYSGPDDPVPHARPAPEFLDGRFLELSKP